MAEPRATRAGSEPITRSVGSGVLWGVAVVLGAVIASAAAVALSGGDVEHHLGGLPLVAIPMAAIGAMIGILVVAPLRQLVARVRHPARVRVLAALACGAAVTRLGWPASAQAPLHHNAPDPTVELVLVATAVTVTIFRGLGAGRTGKGVDQPR